MPTLPAGQVVVDQPRSVLRHPDVVAKTFDEHDVSFVSVTVRRERGAVVVHVPVRYHRRNGRQMILTDGDQPAGPERDANQTLIEAIAKAHRWQEQIEAGQYAGIEDLAQVIGVDRTYVGRTLRLTSLAPDIIEAVLRGDEPDGMSLGKLRRNVPVSWEEQREMWKSKG